MRSGGADTAVAGRRRALIGFPLILILALFAR